MKTIKSQVPGMSDQAYTERGNLIRRIVAQKKAEAAALLQEAKEEKALQRQMAKEGFSSDTDNINAYTDGEKYLAEHYGARLADQTHYESSEGWN